MMKPAIIVSGGGTGIGYATAEYLAQQGCDITIIGRRTEVIEAAAQTIAAATGAVVLAVAADVGDARTGNNVVQAHIEKHGRINGLVCAAGVYEQIHFSEMDIAAWDRINTINLRGSFILASAVSKAMSQAHEAQAKKRIVFIGSVLNAGAEPLTSAYSVTKAGVTALTRGMSVDLAAAGIQVNCVAPGWVRTPMAAREIDAVPTEAMVRINPMARAADPAEIANLVAYLLLQAPNFLTGQTVTIDGGQTARAATL